MVIARPPAATAVASPAAYNVRLRFLPAAVANGDSSAPQMTIICHLNDN
jgi:hypothetical protein